MTAAWSKTCQDWSRFGPLEKKRGSPDSPAVLRMLFHWMRSVGLSLVSMAVRIQDISAKLNGKQYFRIPYAKTGKLNIFGPNAQVSMFAVVRIVDLKQSRTIAGMWSEGKGASDDSGTRQYAMLMNMPTYGGQPPTGAAHFQRRWRDAPCRWQCIPVVRRLRGDSS